MESGRVAPAWQPNKLNAEAEDPVSKTTEKKNEHVFEDSPDAHVVR